MPDSHQVCKRKQSQRKQQSYRLYLSSRTYHAVPGYAYLQAHEQHPHHLPYVKTPVRVSHWQAVVQQGVFVLAMETVGLVPVEGWR